MSKWPMRGNFLHLRFKTFPMTPRTPQCKVFWALLSSSEHSGVLEDSKSSFFPSVGLHPHTWPKQGCDNVTHQNQDEQFINIHIMDKIHDQGPNHVILQVFMCDVVFCGHVYHPFYNVKNNQLQSQKIKECFKISLNNGPNAMDKKLYLSIINCFQQTLFISQHYNKVLGDVKWITNPTRTKPLHIKKLAT